MSISVSKSCDGTVATVSGDKAEVMLFFCIWQTQLWPDWALETSKNAVSLRQHATAVQLIRDDGKVLLHDSSRVFEDACVFAIERCRLLGIEVSA